MIRQITEECPVFSDSWYGKKIHAYVEAYGLSYDFCRLYSSDQGGMMLVYNSTMICDGNFDKNELEEFVSILDPVNIEVSDNFFKPVGYEKIRKTLFKGTADENSVRAEEVKVNTCLDDVYVILEESFGLKEYDMWYADTSHRIRHGMSDVFLWNNTTVTKLFDVNNYVFLSCIATGSKDRGKGRARQLLYYLCSEFEKQGKSVYLYAKDERVSFYESIGFKPVSSEIFYEKKITASIRSD